MNTAQTVEEVYGSTEMEMRMISHFLRYDQTLTLRLDYFTSDEARDLFEFVENNRGIVTDMGEFWELWEIDLKRRRLTTKPYRKFLEKLFLETEIPDEQIDYYLQQIKAFAEMRELHPVFEEALKMASQGKPMEARNKLENGLNRLKTDFPDEHIYRSDFIDNFSSRRDDYNKKKEGEIISRVPTGITKLDKRITGVPPMSFNLIQGETNIGKTFILQELAYQAFHYGLKVVFVTVEIPGRLIETRWDSRITDIPFSKLDTGALDKKQEDWWEKRIKDLEEPRKRGGALGTSFIPEGCTIKSMEAEYSYWTKKWNNPPDMFVIDYLDLLESGRKVWSEQESQGAIARDLKHFTQTKDVIVWSATQIAGRSYGKRDHDLSDIGFSKKKAMSANLILSISSDSDDKDSGILFMNVIKNTTGVRNIQVALYTDFSKGKIDIDPQGELEYATNE